MSKINNAIKIDKTIEDFMIGGRLGDGGFIKKSSNHNTYIVFSHCESQLDYLKWKYEFLNNRNLLNSSQKIKLKNPKTRNCYNNAQNQYYFSTKSMSQLNIYKELNILSLIKKLDELSFSIYILDDGNFNNGCCKISCSKFTIEERYEFISILKNKFNIDCNIYNHPTNKTKDYFRITKKEHIKIKNIILNNIPNHLDVINKIYK